MSASTVLSYCMNTKCPTFDTQLSHSMALSHMVQTVSIKVITFGMRVYHLSDCCRDTCLESLSDCSIDASASAWIQDGSNFVIEFYAGRS